MRLAAFSRALFTSLVPLGTELSLRVVDTDRQGRTVAEILRGNRNVHLQITSRGRVIARIEPERDLAEEARQWRHPLG